MRISVYERLERDRAAVRRARLAAERKEREIASLRCALASIGLDLALVRLQRALRRKYAGQPRVPAGNGRESGRWASGDGNEAGDVDATGSVRRTRVAQNDRQPGRPVDLTEEEARGGHTISGMSARAKASSSASFASGSVKPMKEMIEATVSGSARSPRSKPRTGS
jgi:hypothetical protein